MTVTNQIGRMVKWLLMVLRVRVPFHVRLAAAIRKHLKEANRTGSLTKNELAALDSTLKEVKDWSLVRSHSTDFLREAVRRLWDSGVPPAETVAGLEKAFWQQIERDQEEGTCYSLSLDWTFAMSAAFVKAVKGVDKKTQGRILEAISKLCDSPVEVVGDTVKPLTRNLTGLWRYRIGDYRLIYQPDTKRQVVVLMSFDGRGSAYD